LRFFLLEILRQYAREQLSLRHEMPSVQQRHAHYFLALAENAWSRLHNRETGTWHKYLERDQDNLRATLRYYLATNAEIALRLAAILGEYWYFQGQLSEGKTWLMQALVQSRSLQLPARIKALREAGRIVLTQGDYAQATPLLEESLNLARQFGDKRELAISLTFHGSVALYQLDLACAQPLFEESLSLAQELGDKNRIAIALDHLGLVAMCQGEHTKAHARFEESLAIQQALGGDVTVEAVLFNLGYNELQQGKPNQAFGYLQQSLALSLKKGQKEAIIWSLEGLATLAGLYGDDLERKGKAIRLFGAAAALRNVLGIVRPPMHCAFYEWSMAIIHSQLDDAAFTAAWTEGQAMTLEEAVAYAVANRDPA
jgi:tetratricopeptide (TPR) repeat protein